MLNKLLHKTSVLITPQSATPGIVPVAAAYRIPVVLATPDDEPGHLSLATVELSDGGKWRVVDTTPISATSVNYMWHCAWLRAGDYMR